MTGGVTMELFVLGLALGGAAGIGGRRLAEKREAPPQNGKTEDALPRSRSLTKSVARRYLKVTGAAVAVRTWTKNIRADFLDAVEEVRQEQQGEPVTVLQVLSHL